MFHKNSYRNTLPHHLYQIIDKIDDPNAPWDSIEYNSALKITLRVDVPQKNYQFIFRAIGNSGLASEWTQIYELFVP